MPSVKKHPVSFVFTLWRGDSCQQCIRALWSRENVPEQHKYVISFRFPSYYLLPNDVTDIPHSRIEVIVCLPWDLQCRFRILLWSHQSEKCHNKILKCDFGSENLIDNSLRRNQKTSEKSHLFLSVVLKIMTMMMMTRKLKRRRQLSKLYFAKVTGRERSKYSLRMLMMMMMMMRRRRRMRRMTVTVISVLMLTSSKSYK